MISGGLIRAPTHHQLFAMAWHISASRRITNYKGVVGWKVVVGAFGAEGRWFDSTSSRHVGTLGKSFTRNCLYDVMWRSVAALRLKFDSCYGKLGKVVKIRLFGVD